MAEKVGSIYYDLDLDDKKFKRGVNSASEDVKTLRGRFEAAEAGSFALLGGLTAVGVGAAAFGAKSIKTSANLETMRQGFVTLLGSTEKANEAIEMIKRDAAATPFEVAGLIEANQLLTSVTKDAGRSEKILLNVGKALTSMGKGSEELDRIILNLQQISATGVITEMDIRQFGMAGINILELLADYYGTTKDKAVDMVKDSSDAFGDLEKAFEKAGTGSGRFATAFETQAGTFNQLWSNLMDNLNIFGADLVEQLGLFDKAKEAVDSINKEFTKFNKDVDEAGGFTNYLNDKLRDNEKVIYIVSGALTTALLPALVSIAGAIWGIIAPIAPFLIIGAILGGAIYLIGERFGGWSNIIEKVRERLSVFWEFIQTYILPVLQQIGEKVMEFLQPSIEELKAVITEELLPALREWWHTFQTELLPALQALWEIIGPILIPFLEKLGLIIGGALLISIRLMIEGLKFWIRVYTEIIKKGTELMQSIADIVGYIRLIPSLLSAAGEQIAKAIINPFKQAFDWISRNVERVKQSLDKLNPFHRESPSLVDWVNKGTSKITDLYGSMFDDLNNMSVENRVGFTQSASALSSGLESGRSEQPLAQGQTNVTINLQGVMARSRSDLRDIGSELISAVNEDLRARGIPELGGGKILGAAIYGN